MAYRTLRRGRRSYTRKATRRPRSGYGGASRRRRYPTTRRRYTKRMSPKRILNLTSRKKKDNMLTYTNQRIDSVAGNVIYNQSPAVLTGQNTYVFPWIPTARDLTIANGGNYPTIANESARTASTCYMRGVKEFLKIRTNNGRPWQWRRVCFTMKGPTLNQADAPGSYYWIETTNGLGRVVNALTPAAYGPILRLIFDGTQDSDWNDVFNAKLDTQRITVKSDVTRVIQSGNDNGVIRPYKLWYPMNKNLVYDDEERAAGQDTSQYSITGKAGMGDYYIIDFFQCGDGGTSSDILTMSAEATLYWHEK